MSGMSGAPAQNALPRVEDWPLPGGPLPLDIALSLAASGLPVFPCREDKSPVVKHGFLSATTDPAIIRSLFATRRAKLVGVPTGPASGIDVLDLDYRHGALEWEQANQHRLPETRTHQTMSGGRHHLFAFNPEVRNSAGRIGKGIDVRGSGGFIIMPPSAGYSVISDVPMAPWPAWLLVPGLALPPPPKERPAQSDGPYIPASDARVEGWRVAVLKTVSSAADGQKHARLRDAALALGGLENAAGFCFTEDEAVGWLLNALPATAKDIRLAERTVRWGFVAGRDKPIKLENREAHHHAGRPPPANSPADYGTTPSRPLRIVANPDDQQAGPVELIHPTSEDPPPHDPMGCPVDALIAEFNSRYMVVNEAGRAVVYEKTFDTVMRRHSFTRITFDDLARFYMNHKIRVGADDRRKNVAHVWLAHPDRRQFIRGMIFDPSGADPVDGTLNLWSGFGVVARRGDWSLMRDHIRTIICMNERESFDYIMGWMARMFQFPAKLAGTAVVLRSAGEGTGKGVLGRALRHMLGQHGAAITGGRQLTGNFNAHLRDCVFLFADEIFCSGDKATAAVLNRLITEDTLFIEGKYANGVEAPNLLHIMAASNEDWVVPAKGDARRYFVRDVSEDRKGDFAYFAAIVAQMEAGGYEAMLHDLLAYDLTDFNIRKIPETAGLLDQKQRSLSTQHKWLLDVLYRGYVYVSRTGLDDFGVWFDVVSTELLYASYTAFAASIHERSPITLVDFGKFMRSFGTPTRPRGRAITGESEAGRIPKLIMKERPPCYSMGTLDNARERFCTATRLSVEWQNDINFPMDEAAE